MDLHETADILEPAVCDGDAQNALETQMKGGKW